ncbi:molybdopterin-dependent oxidoreductase [Thioclava sp. FR2]|uniref:molybdopterin-dependent oxidoreductase n=1 Tax=Thioclava sp. FR2 TaxID=3445780 RepID=UPI003EBDBA30
MVTVKSTCPYCGVGCGVLLTAGENGSVSVKGDPDHPANFGRLCSKGSALGETVGLHNRLLAPQIAGKEADWDAALDLVAARFSAAIKEHGPDAVAFYVSGQLLTEDYYVANKLMKGFIGSANIDTNSRLCMASSVAGHRRAFGTDTVPGQYEDLEQADLVVLVGSNLAWCHPILFQRLAAAKAANPAMKVVVVDPRRTATCDLADLHLALRPGSDAALFNALLVEIVRAGKVDAAFIGHTTGLDAALAAAEASASYETGLSEADLSAFLKLWTETEKVVTVYSQGINQSTSGTDKVNAILNCHLATGRIGRPGMGPFSVTGQPNAMGGREVGGLANMLACHLDLENAAHRAAVQDFWHSPTMAEKPGLKAVDMFRAVEDGRIKALWIIHTNPAVSMPEADRVARAISNCAFTVVSDVTAATDTARLADVLLPAAAWGEKDGTVTNSERRISRQRPYRDAPGKTRPDWWQLAEVARRMGFHGFEWNGPDQIFAEYAALSGVAGSLGSDFDISDYAGTDKAEYDRQRPFVWPASEQKKGGRFFADGRFHTADGKARLVAVTPREPQQVGGDQPFRLNTGRIRDQWHTMTRTARAPRLNQHLGEPFLELHPEDARSLGISTADLVEVSNAYGRGILRVLISDRVGRGTPFAPMHWTGETAPTGRIDALVPSLVDPISGQPESKAAAVALRRFQAGWYGFAVSSCEIKPQADYWALSAIEAGYRVELAGNGMPEDWERWARSCLSVPSEASAVAYHDAARGQVRIAFAVDDVVCAALFVGPQPVALSRGTVEDLLGQPLHGGALSGRPSGERPDPGPVVCACFGVGRNTIAQAISEGGCRSVPDLGKMLQAGTNCGSCKPELAALIAQFQPMLKEAAE